MAETDTAWPRKTRELHSHHFDSTIWNDFVFRDDDIVIGTYAKSGTTWVQQIVAQLIFNGAEELEVAEMSPWLDLRVPPKEVKLAAVETQRHRRFLKTHLPVDALVFSPRAKYLYIGRDGRDVMWSEHNHFANGTELLYQALNDTPGRVGPPIGRPPASIRQYFLEWLEGDGYPLCLSGRTSGAGGRFVICQTCCSCISLRSRPTCQEKSGALPCSLTSRSTRAAGTRSWSIAALTT
jgi:aryl sulfotransferase